LFRLSPPEQARVIMALLGIVLLGVVVAALILVWGRRVRRIARSAPRTQSSSEDRWYRKPLGNPDDEDRDGPAASEL